jgi:hypothetical protein
MHMQMESISQSTLSEEVKGSMGSELSLGKDYQDEVNFQNPFRDLSSIPCHQHLHLFVMS